MGNEGKEGPEGGKGQGRELDFAPPLQSFRRRPCIIENTEAIAGHYGTYNMC